MEEDTVNMDDLFKTMPMLRLHAAQKDLQLTAFELVYHQYPLPFESGFIQLPHTRSCYEAPVPNMYALDCEMIETKAPNGTLWRELARVSVVDHNLKVVLDILVKPKHAVFDYLTRYSGLTAEIMADAKLTLPEVQELFMKRFDSTTIFVGHSLESDLHAMGICHLNVIDTAVLHCRKFSCRQKPKLKLLCALHLNLLIQTGFGHHSIEDAKAAMILALYWLIEPRTFGLYHLPHGVQTSNFFESNQQFFQVNIIPTVDTMFWYWLDSFLASLTRLLTNTEKKHPGYSFKLCPYYFLMPNFEVASSGPWGVTFFVAIIGPEIANTGLSVESEPSLSQTLLDEFTQIKEKMRGEKLTMPCFILKRSELPIWVWQPDPTISRSLSIEENLRQSKSLDDDTTETSISISTPSLSSTSSDSFQLPKDTSPFALPTASPTLSSTPPPNDPSPLEPLTDVKNRDGKKRRKRRWRQNRHRRKNNKKKAAIAKNARTRRRKVTPVK